MALDTNIRNRLTLPAICAPMFTISGPELVGEACKAGIIGALPAHNASSRDEFAAWLDGLSGALRAHGDATPGARIAPVAVNLPTKLSDSDASEYFAALERNAVDIVITAVGDPTEITKRVHDWGGRVFHDVTNLRFAEKAIRAGVDGLTCIGAGGGGHSGTISPLALIPKIRSIFSGTLIMAGAVANGAAIRAAEVLGADLAYLGTRFIATREARAPDAYKQMLLADSWEELLYTNRITGIPASWLARSMAAAGLDSTALPEPLERGSTRKHLPPGALPWSNIWSAGQGVALIDDVPTTTDLVTRLRAEYAAACAVPDMAAVARLA